MIIQITFDILPKTKKKLYALFEWMELDTKTPLTTKLMRVKLEYETFNDYIQIKEFENYRHRNIAKIWNN